MGRPALFFFSAVLLFSASLLVSCGKRARLEDRAETLHASDGITLPAHLFVPTRPNAPGLILVHRLGANATLWEPLAVRAQQSGYLVVTFDLRGHGASRDAQGLPMDYKSFTDSNWHTVLHDIDAAKKLLLDAGADPNNLFVGGEGLGASLALQYAAAHPDMQGLVMLSPALNDHGIDAEPLLAALAERPTLLVWSEGDAYAASSGSTLKAIAPGHVESHTYPGTAHGTDIFATSVQAVGQIVVWLDQMLEKPEGSQAPVPK